MASSKEEVILGHIVLKINQDRAQMLRQGSEQWRLDAEMLSVVPGEGVGDATLALQGV